MLLGQADLKVKAKEMDERKDEEERVRRGEPSAIETIYSDEVGRKLHILPYQILKCYTIHVRAGFPLASRQGTLAEREWWDRTGA